MIPLLAQARPDTCLNIKNVASSVMQARQAGAEAQVLVGALGKTKKEEWLYRAHMQIIIEAYQIRVYATEMYKKRIISEFANKYYIACWKGSV
tara:strand:+ start:97 stop:375 length:279 start_codon:yes stop_codon:yes gene_type:complete